MVSTRRRAIAVDAMGGDSAPLEIVRGAIAFALESLDQRVFLVGRRAAIDAAVRTAFAMDDVAPAEQALVADLVTIVTASEVIGMDEHPSSAVRAKRDSSVVRACKLVAAGRAGAIVSAGNSGATMAAALLAMQRIDGVARPAIGTSLPARGGRTFLLDAGANTDCKPEWLAEFALMGNVYARTMLGVMSPRIGLLSNGEEAGKGSTLVQRARSLIEALPLRFVGNIEGRDLFNGRCDVAVTDGFTGNVVLKTAEGAGEYLFAEIRERAEASIGGRLGGALLRRDLRPIRDQVDYRHTGGALLLGVRGEAVIAHGRSDALAVANAMKVAHRAIQHNVSGTIADALAATSATLVATASTSPGTKEQAG